MHKKGNFYSVLDNHATELVKENSSYGVNIVGR